MTDDDKKTSIAAEEVDRLPDRAMRREQLALVLVGGGAVGALITLLRSRRGPLDWVVSLSLMGAGLSFLLEGRQEHIHDAEEVILAELEGLDPIARAQVLKTVAERQLGRKKK